MIPPSQHWTSYHPFTIAMDLKKKKKNKLFFIYYYYYYYYTLHSVVWIKYIFLLFIFFIHHHNEEDMMKKVGSPSHPCLPWLIDHHTYARTTTVDDIDGRGRKEGRKEGRRGRTPRAPRCCCDVRRPTRHRRPGRGRGRQRCLPPGAEEERVHEQRYQGKIASQVKELTRSRSMRSYTPR